MMFNHKSARREHLTKLLSPDGVPARRPFEISPASCLLVDLFARLADEG
jgi:hypothetical protein